MNVVLTWTLFLCCLAVTRCDDAKANAEKVQAGVEAASAILEVMGDEKFSKNFGRIGAIAAKMGPFLGAMGPAVALITMFLPAQPSAELQYMKKKFAEMDAKFDRVFNQFGEVKSLIQETGLKTQYSTYEHSILSLSAKLQTMLAAPIADTDVHKRSFITQYTSGYNGATDKLWRGMMKTFVSADNIPLTAMQYTNNDRKRVQNIMKGMMNLILQGVKVHLGYLSVKNLTHDYNVQKAAWETKVKQLVDHMKSMDREVTNRWYNQMKSDVPGKLAEWNGRSHSDFGNRLYSFLTSKYDWRDWHVVVYDELHGGDKHWVKWCSGMNKFRTHGRNLVVASVDQSKTAINIGHARGLLSRASTRYCKSGFWGSRSCHDRSAKDAYNHLASELRSGCKYAAVGVIRKSASITHKGPSNRLTYLDNNAYKIHAFG